MCIYMHTYVIHANYSSGNASTHFQKEFVRYTLQIIVTVFTINKDDVQCECTTQGSLQENEKQKFWSENILPWRIQS